MAKTAKIKDSKTKKIVKAVKKGKYFKFYCPCGAEMWNNTVKKRNGDYSNKFPDLKCQDKEDCTEANGKGSFAMWLTDKQKKSLGFSSAKSKGKSKSKGSYNNRNSYQSNKVVLAGIEASFYAAWAKDMALFLAQQNDVKDWDELRALYDNCLKSVSETLQKHVNDLNRKEHNDNVKNVEDDEEEDFGEPEDVEDEEEESVEVDDDDEEVNLDDLDGLDI